jgi:serine/threonine-protein kinase
MSCPLNLSPGAYLFRARQKIGKYRIVKRLSNGPLADVFHAFDTIHHAHVALKVPHVRTGKIDDVEDFVNEVRVSARLDHPNILPVQNAAFIGEHFVIAMPLGIESLGDRIERRMANALALDFAGQALAAVAHAHERKIIHCDIKPENFIIFPDNRLRLSDFGFAKLGLRTIKASGSGTIDYIAPEQAMGRPKFQSDVFSLGLVLYRLLSGRLPEFPFDWPPVGHERIVQRVGGDVAAMLRRAITLDAKARFADATEMLAAFEKLDAGARRQKRKAPVARPGTNGPAWQRLRWREFRRAYRGILDARHDCRRCEGPVAMEMQACPWCGVDNPAAGADTRMPAHCPRCERGVKLDWNYCAWCYGPGFEQETRRRYTDKAYTARCARAGCGGPLMPHMRYCPWCRAKVTRRWPLRRGDPSCRGCQQPIAADYWKYCAWCREPVGGRAKGRGVRRSGLQR